MYLAILLCQVLIVNSRQQVTVREDVPFPLFVLPCSGKLILIIASRVYILVLGTIRVKHLCLCDSDVSYHAARNLGTL